MKASDVRIGNYIYFKNGIDTVLGTEMEYIMSNHTRRWEKKHITPISITEEWLLKFGFVKAGTVFRMKIENYIRELEYNIECDCFGMIDNHETIYFSWNLKHVHTLQNLYFALTGEELKIK